MSHDAQNAVLEKIRAVGVHSDVTLAVSPADALRVLDGSGIINSDFSRPEAIDTYEGTQDDDGVLSWKLDRQLPKAVGRLDAPGRSPVMLSLADVIP